MVSEHNLCTVMRSSFPSTELLKNHLADLHAHFYACKCLNVCGFFPVCNVSRTPLSPCELMAQNSSEEQRLTFKGRRVITRCPLKVSLCNKIRKNCIVLE